MAETTQQIVTALAAQIPADRARDRRGYAAYITSFMAELVLTRVQAGTIFDTLDRATLERNIELMKAIQHVGKYEGFNPREIVIRLVRRHEEASAQALRDPASVDRIEFPVTEDDGTVRNVVFTSNESFTQDMLFICMMFISRGAAFDKIVNKSNRYMQSLMGMIKTKYNINTEKRRPGVTLDSKTITIPRISASFPNLTIGSFINGFGRCVFDIHNFFPDKNPPRALFAPFIGSALVAQDDAPKAVLLAIAIKTDDVLHQTGAKTTLKALMTYLDASYKSNALPAETRLAYCFDWGLVEQTNGNIIYKIVVTELRPLARAMVQRWRPEDPDLPSIMEKI